MGSVQSPLLISTCHKRYAVVHQGPPLTHLVGWSLQRSQLIKCFQRCDRQTVIADSAKLFFTVQAQEMFCSSA
jgi:hypothetical protein